MIEIKNIGKSFGKPAQQVLQGISFSIKDGEFVSISGRSGSGKSTLLYIISSLDMPTIGEILIDGNNTAKMDEKEIHEFRNLNIGFIFQFHYLLPELTALENILLPPRNLGKHDEFMQRAQNLLKEMNIEHVAHKLPGQMSGGEQQRVAIARALIMSPRYIFADEPTGNLDTVNGDIVMQMLKKINREEGTTICLVTHEPEYSKMAQTEVFLIDGQVDHINN